MSHFEVEILKILPSAGDQKPKTKYKISFSFFCCFFNLKKEETACPFGIVTTTKIKTNKFGIWLSVATSWYNKRNIILRFSLTMCLNCQPPLKLKHATVCSMNIEPSSTHSRKVRAASFAHRLSNDLDIRFVKGK